MVKEKQNDTQTTIVMIKKNKSKIISSRKRARSIIRRQTAVDHTVHNHQSTKYAYLQRRNFVLSMDCQSKNVYLI